MLNNIPNLRQLRAFAEVARCQSISAAAERIFLSQSAVTQAIGKLEARLGVALFVRRHNGMFLTDSGDLLVRRVDRCMAFLRTGTREAIRIADRKTEGVRASNHPSGQLTNAHLRALLALQTATSYSTAARTIGISQPAVYRAAGELEGLLNAVLFEKTSVGISLTRAALRLARFVLLGMREIEQGLFEIFEMQGADSTLIRVGSMPLARTYILPVAINRISKLKPDIRVDVLEGPYDDLLNRLLHGELDLLIGALRDPAPSADILQEQLLTSPISVVARRDHPLAERGRLSLSELTGYPWVVPREGTPARALFNRLVAEEDPTVLNGVIECSSQIVIRELLLGSDRLTFISSHQFEHEQQEGILTVLDIDMPPVERPIGITTRKDWQPTTTQRLFISIIKSLAQALAQSSGRIS
jgi:DNA-binding transcriptional LysR family regulator